MTAPARPGCDEIVRPAACPCGATFEQRALLFEGRALFATPSRCPACLRAQAEREEVRERERRATAEAATRAARLAELAVPPLYAEVSLDAYRLHGDRAAQARQATALRIARRYLAAWPHVETLLLFQGGPGTGKGHIAWSLAKAVVAEHGGSARVVKLARLVRDLREPWRSKEGAGEERRLRAYRAPDLLVIDEVSRHAFYGQSVQQHLYDVLDDRLEHQRPTVLTTNETDAGIAEILGPALLDRLQGSGGVVRFGDTSWRTRALEATA